MNVFNTILGFITIILGGIVTVIGVFGIALNELFTYSLIIFAVSFAFALTLEQFSIYLITKEHAKKLEENNKEYKDQKQELERIREDYIKLLKK